MVTIKSKYEIEKMREAGRVANLAQKAIERAIRPGVSTYELDRIAEETMRQNGAIPAEKGYPSGMRGVPDFPGSICASSDIFPTAYVLQQSPLNPSLYATKSTLMISPSCKIVCFDGIP